MKKSVVSLLLIVFLSLAFFAMTVSPLQALGDDNAKQEMHDFEGAIKDDRANLDQTAYGVFKAILKSGIEETSGCWSCEGDSRSDGAIRSVGKMIGFTFEPAASTEVYIADLLHNMNLAEPAYAQGLGFSSLQPVLELWKVFRNISYVFFVFLFLVIGFAIMFRKNLGGQTAVTVQQALPRIIIALVVVSFSYAIAGLMIDLMWLLMLFLITMFNTAGLIPSSLGGGYDILDQNVFQVFFGILGSGFVESVGNIVGDLVTNMLSGGGDLSDFASKIVGGVTGVVASLVILVAVLFAMFRTFFSLIKVYFEIILMIIFSPIVLMLGAINGNAFGSWLKGLIANLMVFPVLLVFVIIGYMFINFAGSNSLPQQFNDSGFVPPFVPGRGAGDQIGLIGGLAAIMLLPEVVAIVGKFKPSSIFDEFGGKAWGNAMKGRGIGVPAGSALLGAGAGLIGGTGVGLARSANALRRGEGLSAASQKLYRSAGLGALGGAFGGGAISSGVAYRAVKGMGGNLVQQAKDVATEYTIDAQMRKWQEKEGIRKRVADNVMLQRQLNAKRSTPQTTTEVSSTPPETQAGESDTRTYTKNKV
jgi:hypothetical protein